MSFITVVRTTAKGNTHNNYNYKSHKITSPRIYLVGKFSDVTERSYLSHDQSPVTGCQMRDSMLITQHLFEQYSSVGGRINQIRQYPSSCEARCVMLWDLVFPPRSGGGTYCRCSPVHNTHKTTNFFPNTPPGGY